MAFISRLTFPRGRRIVDPDEPINQGLLGWWPLDGRTIVGTKSRDVSSNSNDGDLIGSPTLVSGLVTTALNCNGSSQYVSVANYINPTSISLSAWVKTTNTGSIRIIFARDNFLAARTHHFRITATNVLEFIVFGAVGMADVVGTLNITDGRWHFVAGTYDQTTTRIFVDGVADGTSTVASGALASNILSTDIGALQGDVATYAFIGQINDARIHGRALLASEISRMALDRSGTLGWTTPTRTRETMQAPPAPAGQVFQGWLPRYD